MLMASTVGCRMMRFHDNALWWFQCRQLLDSAIHEVSIDFPTSPRNTVHGVLVRRLLDSEPCGPLKAWLVEIIFKNSVRTSKRTPHFTITKINFLTLFKKIIPVYAENDTKHINTKCSLTDC